MPLLTREDWPLVGRTAEAKRITGVLTDPAAAGVVLSGPGGIGKSRLAAACLFAAEASGCATARVTATQATAGVTLGALSPLLPELREGATGVLARARAAMTARAGDRPLVVLVDDGHLLDDASASLLFHLAAAREMRVLLTLRAGEAVREPITALWKDGHAERFELGGLADDDLVALLDAVLGAPVEDATRQALLRVSEGNPLALRELLMAADDAGRLVRRPTGWRLEGPLPVSSGVVQLVEERLAGLDRPAREALEIVALGEPIGLGVLEAVTGPTVLAELENRGLVVVRDDGARMEVLLNHPLHGEVLRAGVAPERTRTVLQALADALAATGVRRAGDVLRLAEWRVATGTATDAALLESAARQAQVALDLVAALRFAEVAWTLEPTVARGQLYGWLLCHVSRHAEAELVLADAEQRAVTDRERATVAMARSESLFRMGRPADAVRVVLDAEAAMADEGWRAELIGHRATYVLLGGRPRDALSIVESWLEGDEIRPRVEAAIVAGQAYTWDGRPETAVRVMERAYIDHTAIWEQEAMQSEPAVHVFGLIGGLTVAGRLGDAEALGGIALDSTIEADMVAGKGPMGLQLARVHANAGRPRSARDLYLLTDEWFVTSGLVTRRHFALAGAAQAAAVLGRVDEAAALLDLIVPTSERTVHFNEGALVDAHAWLLAARGDVDAALALFDAGADDADADGTRSTAIVLLHGLARLGGAERAVDRARAWAPTLEGPFLAARVDHIGALAAGDSDALVDVADRFEAIGAQLFAAEALASAAGAERHAGGRAAASLRRRALALAEQCEGAVTPGLRGLGEGAELTKTERVVAERVAAGRTNRQIADELFVSPRTVESHLRRVYGKLGVHSRDELADILPPAST